MTYRSSLVRTAVLAFAGSMTLGMAFAQSKYVPVVRKGDTELGGFVGGSFGFDSWHIFGGGNVAYAVTKNIMPYFEYSYFPEIPRNFPSTTTPNGTTTYDYRARIQDYHGGVHIRWQRKSSPIVPYVVFGVGALQTQLSQVSTFTPAGGQPGIPSAPVTRDSVGSAINGGVGIRYYAHERFGFRVEYKVYHPLTGDYPDNFQKLEGGFFLQWSR